RARRRLAGVAGESGGRPRHGGAGPAAGRGEPRGAAEDDGDVEGGDPEPSPPGPLSRPLPPPSPGEGERGNMKAPEPPSSPWQLLYGGAHRLRRRWYRTRARRLPRPVVSVGNLHWGGSGKTPLVAAIAAHLRDRGTAVCILSR